MNPTRKLLFPIAYCPITPASDCPIIGESETYTSDFWRIGHKFPIHFSIEMSYQSTDNRKMLPSYRESQMCKPILL